MINLKFLSEPTFIFWLTIVQQILYKKFLLRCIFYCNYVYTLTPVKSIINNFVENCYSHLNLLLQKLFSLFHSQIQGKLKFQVHDRQPTHSLAKLYKDIIFALLFTLLQYKQFFMCLLRKPKMCTWRQETRKHICATIISILQLQILSRVCDLEKL